MRTRLEPDWFKNGTATKTVDAYLAGTTYAVVYKYTNGVGYQQVLAGQNFEPGCGYWVAFLANGTIYP